MRIVAATKNRDYPAARFKPYIRISDSSFYRKAGSGPGTTLFIGDSNMEQYGPRVEAVIDRRPFSNLRNQRGLSVRGAAAGGANE